MNLAEPLATTIFAVTVFTVFGGVFAYAVYKARERTRGDRAATPGSPALEYFVEYVPEGADTSPIPTGAEATSRHLAVATYGLAALTLAAFAAASVFYVRGHRIFQPGRPAAGASSAMPPIGERLAGAPQTVPSSARIAARPRPPDLATLRRRPGSLFVAARDDADGDGRISPEERARIHDHVPQFIVGCCDDNGAVQGRCWMREVFAKHAILGKATFFMTADYLEGRASYLGGPVHQSWQTLFDEAWGGIHGTSHAPGAEGWSQKRWRDENGTVQLEIVTRLRPPSGWDWASYPWGARAPFLVLSDAYFASLEKLSVRYDASLVVRPPGPPPDAAQDVRDVSWPFTLAEPIPADVELPYLEREKRRVHLSRHALWEVPVYAWIMRPAGAAPRWEPSLDYNLFKHHPCSGDAPNLDAVEVLLASLRAHYRGNRAPFHIGLHAQNYTADRRCERATLETFFARLDRMIEDGFNLRYTSMPELLGWIDRASRE